MKIHPLAALVPSMTPEEYQALKDDISKHGQRVPIIVYDGLIVDGRHRYKACMELGLLPVTEDWNEAGSLAELIFSLNAARRHLSTSQRAALAVQLKGELAKEAKARQLTGKTLASKDAKGGGKGKSAAHAAKIMGVSQAQVERAARIADADDDVFAEVLQGTVTIPEAQRQIDEKKKKTPAPKSKLDQAWEDHKILRDVGGILDEALEQYNAVPILLRSFTNPQSFESAIESLKSNIRGSTPFALCPYCSGDGCRTCRSTGWVPKFTFENFPREFQQGAETRGQ